MGLGIFIFNGSRTPGQVKRPVEDERWKMPEIIQSSPDCLGVSIESPVRYPAFPIVLADRFPPDSLGKLARALQRANSLD